MKKGCLILGLIVAIPFAYIFAYIMFPSVRPKATPSEIFLRLTDLPELPPSTRDLKVHWHFDPLLGEGGATISFSLNEKDGGDLASQFSFQSLAEQPSASDDRLAKIQIKLEDPSFAYVPNAHYERDGMIKTNTNRTIFLWTGTL